MKKLYGFILIPVLLFSCKKSLVGDTEEETYTIKVKEYKTNILLPGVKISLYRCSNYDIEFGCQSTSLFVSHATNSNGEYNLTLEELNKSDEGIILSKAQYWDIAGGIGENYMEPEAWVNVTLKQVNTYPDTCMFRLFTSGEFGFVSLLDFPVPKDSTVKFRLFGNETNEVRWIVFPKQQPCIFGCPPIDSVASGSFTLTPQKFKNVTISVDY
jgi:hypothetical protein